MKRAELRMADLFCGAGGTSSGAVEAIGMLGYDSHLTAVNHWPVAIATHSLNHPKARHFCTGLDSVNPRELFKEGELDLLWASPECTHHSRARGGKPVKDQSRSTAWCVIRWAEALRPNVILVENVPEFREWGPVNAKGEIIKRRKGEIFQSWLNNLRAIGYKVEHRVLCAADYGDPTSRCRLFIQAVRGRRKVVWPHATHPEEGMRSMSSRTWRQRVARDVIDFSVPGTLLTERKRPLAPNTMRRILAGFFKQIGVKVDLEAFILPKEGFFRGNQARSLDDLVPAVCTDGRIHLVEPYLMEFRGTTSAHLDASGKSLAAPVGAVTAGGIHQALIEPMAMTIDHQSDPCGIKTVENPLTTVTVKQRHALVEPQSFMIQMNRGDGEGDVCLRRVKPLDGLMPALCCKGEFALIEPMVLPQQSAGTAKPVGKAQVPTVATAGAVALIEPYLIQYYGAGGSTLVSKPVPTITTKDRHAIVLPVITYQDGTRMLVNFRFRMFMPRELAGAQGFREDYQFSGNTTEQVAQIGNAVPRRLARALVLAALSQDPDISGLIADEEQGREVAA